MDNMIEITSENVKKYGLKIEYLSLTCPVCGHKWGSNPTENKVKETTLVCTTCALKNFTSKI